jgi:hypothetical protein
MNSPNGDFRRQITFASAKAVRRNLASVRVRILVSVQRLDLTAK